MPNTKSAMKRMRQAEKRRLRNRFYRSTARTYVKRARAAIAAGDLEAAQEAIKQAVSALDRAAEKGVIHKNNASRRKSRLMKALQAAQQSAE
ncbi:MAG: 30S ribosomal protein S20, partial [Anaerolineae bacterium]